MRINKKDRKKIVITKGAAILTKKIEKEAVLNLYEEAGLIELSDHCFIGTDLAAKQGLKWRGLYETA